MGCQKHVKRMSDQETGIGKDPEDRQREWMLQDGVEAAVCGLDCSK